jgi:hypothetical protein
MDSHKESLSGKENEVIHGILLRILEKWRRDIGAIEEDLEKTVTLFSESIEQGETPLKSKPVQVMEEAVPETVILPPKEHQSGLSTPSPAVESKGPDILQRPEEPPDKDEFLEETVILKPAKTREKVNE